MGAVPTGCTLSYSCAHSIRQIPLPRDARGVRVRSPPDAAAAVTSSAMTTSNLHKWASLPDPSPAELARATEGDAAAFKLIVERYQGMVYSVAYNVLGNHTDAEDAAQEAFLRCYRKLPQFRSEATFSTWLFRLALTASVDYKRRERRRPEPVETPDLAAAAAPRLGEGVDAATIVAALHDLPEDYRVPTVLRDIYGLPYQGIAEATGRPLGTVKVMVHRGRASLRAQAAGRGRRARPGPRRRSSEERRLMDCSYYRERINLYVDGEMGYLEVAELQAHLSFCPDCAAELAQMGEVRGALAAWGRLELATPPGFAERVMAAVELEPAPGSPKPFGQAVDDTLADARRHTRSHPVARRSRHPRQERHRLGSRGRGRGHRPRASPRASLAGVDAAVKLTHDQVLELLPHRPPFLLVDEVVERRGGRAVRSHSQAARATTSGSPGTSPAIP